MNNSNSITTSKAPRLKIKNQTIQQNNLIVELENKINKNELLMIEKQNEIDNHDILNKPNLINSDVHIFIKETSLKKEVCEEIINLFKLDNKKTRGVYGTNNNIDINIKYTDDLYISNFNHWKKYDEILFNELRSALVDYLLRFTNNNMYAYEMLYNSVLFDTGMQIQRYTKNKGKYVWHTDDYADGKHMRYITFIWYLNDVDIGGETMFLNGYVKPTIGKLILFPATWTYIHKGNVPISNDKYIITGWLSRII